MAFSGFLISCATPPREPADGRQARREIQLLFQLPAALDVAQSDQHAHVLGAGPVSQRTDTDHQPQLDSGRRARSPPAALPPASRFQTRVP